MQGIESLPTIAEDLGILANPHFYDYDTFAADLKRADDQA